jgi:hypothetical protein
MLFYKTSTVMRRKTVATYSHPETLKEIRQYCLANNIKMDVVGCDPRQDTEDNISMIERGFKTETTILADEDQFVLGDNCIIPIPDSIRKLPPVHKVDVAHFRAFPLDTSTDILVMAEEPGYRHTAHYGISPHDENFVLHDNAVIRSHMDDLLDASGSDDATVAKTTYENMIITSVIYDKWDFLIAKIDEQSRICISIPNQRAEQDFAKDNVLSATAACTFARAILLTLRTTGKKIRSYNEHDLRSTILALLITDRSSVEE